jgi:hypothetical protein
VAEDRMDACKHSKITRNYAKNPSPGMWDKLFYKFSMAMPKSLRQRTPGDKLHKLSDILGGTSWKKCIIA